MEELFSSFMVPLASGMSDYFAYRQISNCRKPELLEKENANAWRN
jgi:hypothetical protein